MPSDEAVDAVPKCEVLRTGSLLLQVAETRYWKVTAMLLLLQANIYHGGDSKVAKDCRRFIDLIAELSPQLCVRLTRGY